MAFWDNFFKVGMKKAGANAEELMASIAPDMMQEAEIQTLTEELEDITAKVVAAEKFRKKEQQETAEAEQKVNECLAALEILQSDLNNAEDKTALEEAMAGLLDELEEANENLELEKQEDLEAEENLKFWKQRQKEISEYLKKTKTTSEKTKRALQMQEEKTKRAQERAKYGESGKTASSVATNAMERKLEKLKAEEEVAKQMTKLTSDDSVTKTNDLVVAAMKKARGEVDTSTMSVSDRLAAMKAKMGK